MSKMVKNLFLVLFLLGVVLYLKDDSEVQNGLVKNLTPSILSGVVKDSISSQDAAVKKVTNQKISESEEEDSDEIDTEIHDESALKKHGVNRMMLMAFHDKGERFKEAMEQLSRDSKITLPKLRDDEGAGLIHWAVMGNCLSCISILLKEGHNVNLANVRGETPLVFAVGAGDFEATELLLKSGANPNHSFNKAGYTLLMDSSFEGNIEVSKALLSAKASVNLQDKDGKSALHYAAKEGHRELISLLLEKGANPKLKDLRGKRPLDYALDYHDRSIEKSFQ